MTAMKSKRWASVVLSASVAACGPAMVNASDVSAVYSPTLTEPGQKFVAPEDSARPGETFYYRAAAAWEKSKYAFARDMYRTSASWAYKPAQYSLGVMYFNGDGVAANRALGMAWLALAAERGDPAYVSYKDNAYTQMTEAEFSRANVLWREMKRTYGDAVALKRARNRWLQVRRAATGSHLGEGMGPMKVGGLGRYGADHGAQIVNGWEATGPGSVDAAVAYSRLRSTANPYDDALRQTTGTTNVGELIPISDEVKARRNPASQRFN